MANNPFYKLASISAPKSKSSKSVKTKEATPKRKAAPKRKATPKRRGNPKRKAPKRQLTARRGVEPVRKKTTKKQQNPWLKHVMTVLKELKKENPKASLKDAIPIATKSYKKGQRLIHGMFLPVNTQR